jgi:molybdenum cofactor cytidylyltransferase
MTGIYSVILAAGSSKRLGFNKLTLRIDSEPVIRRTATPFVEAGLGGEVIVVAGSDIAPVAAALKGLNVRVVRNEDHRQGMSSSIRAALPWIEGATAVFFHLGDKPFVKKELLIAMVDRYRDTGRGIIVPVHDGKKGHPVLMSYGPYREEMRLLNGDKGLREVLEKHSADVLFIEGDEGILFDIDTGEDLETLRRRGYRVEKGVS